MFGIVSWGWPGATRQVGTEEFQETPLQNTVSEPAMARPALHLGQAG